MRANTILKHLNILKRDANGFFFGSEFIVMQAFIHQCARETSIGALSQQLPL